MSLPEKIVAQIEGNAAMDKPGRRLASAVGKLTASRTVVNVLSGTWLGHAVHPVLTDLPIGAWSMASLLDLTSGARDSDAAQRLVGVGVLAAVPTALTGASDWSTTYGPSQRLGLVHGISNAVGTGLQAASWLARRRGNRATGVALSVLGVGVVAGGGYLGGHLTLKEGIGVDHTTFQQPTSAWTDVAAESDLVQDIPLRVDAAGTPVVLVRHGGAISALSTTCNHAGGPLDEGTVEDDGCLRCPWHGSVFRLGDGAVVRGPATYPQTAWQVRVTEGRVQVRA